MANQNTPIDILALHDAILNAVTAAFPIFATVDDYPVDHNVKAVPAFFLDMEEMHQSNDMDAEDGTVPVEFRFCGRIVMASNTPTVGRTIRALALALGALINKSRFGMPINAAIFEGAFPDAFSPALDQYTVWRVEWRMVGFGGASVWLDTSEPIKGMTFHYSFAPDIGIPFKDEYQVAD